MVLEVVEVVSRVHLLPYHDTGMGKYRQLGRTEPPRFHAPDAQQMQDFLVLFKEAGYTKIKIGG